MQVTASNLKVMSHRIIKHSLFTLTGLLFVLIMMMGCSNTVHNIRSSYQPEGIVVDSSLNEWSNQLTYDNRSKLFYDVTHDQRYLYVALQTKDPLVERKIMAFGLTMWLDTTAKKKKGRGIRYPVPKKERLPLPEREEDKDLPLRARQARPKDSRRFLRTTDRKHMLLLDFDGKDRQQVDVNKSEDIRVGIRAQSSSGVSYEARIPFARIFDAPLRGEKKLSIGFVTGHLDAPDRPSGIGSPGGMIPYGGRRRGGSRKGGTNEGFDQLRESTELWLKGVKLTLR